MTAEEKENTQTKPRITIPPGALAILPLRNTVLFPSTITPLVVGRRNSLQVMEEAVRQELAVGFVTQIDASVDKPQAADLYPVGTSASVLRMFGLPDGQRQVIIQGQQRFEIKEFIQTAPFLVARVSMIEEGVPHTKDFDARVLHLRQEALKALSLLPAPLQELRPTIERIENPLVLIDTIASILDLPVQEKQELLAILDPVIRAQKVSEKLSAQIELLELSKKIGEETKEAMDKTQREYFLREQLKAIQKELGAESGQSVEAGELRKKIADAKMPPEVEKEALRELSRFERMPEMAAEHSTIRTYLDWMTELPWSISSEERIDLQQARKILDEDHYGLDKVKKRIIEFLAVRKLKPEGKSPILCFVGPPGVGKTSLGQSIARAMNRKFVRQSLGGVHDEADIRGHRRTYVGSLPGNIIQGIRKAGTNNPVFMLDEIDKLNASFQGDPSAALLEVLDPAQNSTFQDHYLAVPLISAKTRSQSRNMSRRGEGNQSALSEEEKLASAKKYRIPRQTAQNGLDQGEIGFTDEAIREVINSYTREAGVRQLERELGAICRGVATRIAEGRKEPITIERGAVKNYLGPQKFFNEVALRTSLPGVATGLAWTPVGGDILFVEATKMPGNGKLQLTGQLGDVMKESAQAAFSLIKSRAESLGIEAEVFRQQDLHVHIPAGAIPKDGPSAGVTLFVALVSLLLDRRVRTDVAMTGEISLRGLVLPVGGIKEKVLAAKRAGLSRVLLPDLNQRDLEDIPPAALEGMRFEFLKTVDEALAHALEPSEDLSAIPSSPSRARGEGSTDISASLDLRRR
jgi:ATP-dependent Lon protease